jgi:uncharacterized protein YdeI (YjbR/CyaY-like superfamily)
MRPPGLAAFERRRADQTAGYSFEQDELVLPDGYEDRLLADPAAAAFWGVATPTYRKVVTAWILTAKQEQTRERRLAQLIDDSAHGRLVPPQRYGGTPAWVERAAQAARDAT